ncbi:XdhC family protein [Amycolatopsis acidiphila]|uniref:YHS domain-containing protein n=1 Tax=Amycolatopsis acidiphila TaxID=715473 RepID=A0A558A5X1_9PSEU|nr:XdhC family protein [Amycolatopsis acidiphila]TVT19667.1 YHS domain-containing protein [Amycolatopsis acidiphila]UIJ61815.1 XdhC family protein [Amycolatopsis acidiphila]GHG57791.1 carbon monoxide dehydrogenase F protein [Amycolatopsis acidiphila]
MSRPELLAQADSLRARRRPFVLATVVRVQRPTSAKPGDCALVLPDGTIEGFVGGDCAESTVRLQGIRLLGTGRSTLLRITPEARSDEKVEDGVVTVGNPCLSGGTLEIFLEAQLPPALVVVHGDAPVARALVSVGAALGYDVRTDPSVPEDADAVLVASHGRDEEAVLRAAVAAGVGYVGLIASRRRGAAVLEALELDADFVHTPAGLDIGARTPGEIAVSVYAEMIATRRRPPSPETLPEPAEAPDPVCGMSVAVTRESLQLPYEGRTYYFCGPGCRQAFAEEPARYGADG